MFRRIRRRVGCDQGNALKTASVLGLGERRRRRYNLQHAIECHHVCLCSAVAMDTARKLDLN